jgi:hypothetical protein
MLGQQAGECLKNLKDSVTAVLEALPCELQQPRDVYRTLGIDRMIGWNIYKLYEVDDCFLSVRHIPRKAAFRGFLRAAAKQGVPDSLLDVAEEDFNRFEEMVEEHAGDRPSIEMMLLAYSEDGLEQASLEHRKMSFTGNRFLYGLEARTRLTITLFEPNGCPESWMLTLVKGSFGLRRNRPDIPWFYVRPRLFTEFSDHPTAPVSSPLVPGESKDLPYYGPFCNCSLPGLKTRAGFVDSIEDIFPLETGNAGLMDLVFAEVLELNGFDMSKDGSTSARVVTPCHSAATDIIVPTDRIDVSRFSPRIVSSVLEESDTYKSGVIDMAGSILPGKPFFITAPTPEMPAPDGVPAYKNIISDIFRRRDLNPLNYSTIRTLVEFPVIPSAIDIAWTSETKI